MWNIASNPSPSTFDKEYVEYRSQRLFNFKDDNVLNYQLLQHPLYRTWGWHRSKSPQFFESVNVANSWKNFLASRQKNFTGINIEIFQSVSSPILNQI